jgi:hypothetical protein
MICVSWFLTPVNQRVNSSKGDVMTYEEKVRALLRRGWEVSGDYWYLKNENEHSGPYSFDAACKEEVLE